MVLMTREGNDVALQILNVRGEMDGGSQKIEAI